MSKIWGVPPYRHTENEKTQHRRGAETEHNQCEPQHQVRVSHEVTVEANGVGRAQGLQYSPAPQAACVQKVQGQAQGQVHD